MPDDVLPRLLAAIGPATTITGWATIDAERTSSRVAPDDELLGARCRLAALEAEPGGEATEAVLLEPSTEGPLAAGLARHGEGPLALYVRAGRAAVERARRAGFALSRPAGGPFGRQRRVLIGPRDGPFVLIVEPGPGPAR